MSTLKDLYDGIQAVHRDIKGIQRQVDQLPTSVNSFLGALYWIRFTIAVLALALVYLLIRFFMEAT
jgi:hypothetical protein